MLQNLNDLDVFFRFPNDSEVSRKEGGANCHALRRHPLKLVRLSVPPHPHEER